jgi:hypothetical protein
MNIFLTTYPRSGSWLFAKALYEQTGFPINKFHWKVISELTTISIVRDPLETIASKVAMETTNKNYELTKTNIELNAEEYISFYRYIDEHVSIVIDYDDLISNLDFVIDKVSSLLDLQILDLNKRVPAEKNMDHPEIGHWMSSKSLDHYEKAMEMSKDIDLSKAYQIYNKLLRKSI